MTCPCCCWLSSPGWGSSTVHLRPLFPCCPFWKDITMPSPHLRNGDLYSSLSTEYLHTLFRIILHRGFAFPPDIYVFVRLFSSVWTHGYFYILSFTQIQPYLFCCSVCSSFGHWKLSVVCCVSLTQDPFFRGGALPFWHHKMLQSDRSMQSLSVNL